MLIWKYGMYLSIQILLLFSTKYFPQNNSHNHYFVHKNTTIDSISSVQTSEIIRLKRLLKLNSNYSNASEQEIKKMDSLVANSLQSNSYLDKMVFEYNLNYQLSMFNRYYSKNQNWNIYRRTTYVYGNLEKIIHRITESWNGEIWINDLKENYFFNDNGTKEKLIFSEWKDDSWNNFRKKNFTYNLSDLLVSELNEIRQDSLWELESKSEFYYNGLGLPTEVLVSIFEFNKWHKYFKSRYHYDSFDKQDSIIVQKWNGNYWLNYIKLINDTIKNGQIVNENIDVWYNNQWFKSSRIVYHYDKDKYFLHAHCEYWQGDRWLPNIDVIHVRNPDGFEIHYLTHQVDIYYEQPTSVKEENPSVVNEFVLEQNYPNPFNPSTTIKYNIPLDVKRETKNVQLIVYDILGREVASLVNEQQKPGNYAAQFDAADLPSGIYFYRLQSGASTSLSADKTGSATNNFVEVKKMMLLK